MSKPQYAIIKDHIVKRIQSNQWVTGDKVSSENQLVEQFSVSRMTARRALQELADEEVLVRTQGVGSFVADQRPISSLLEIRNIAEEITGRGNRHSAQIVKLQCVYASAMQASLLSIVQGSELYYSVIVHCENGVPVQYEERLVNPVLAPEYIQQDFQKVTPNQYLSAVAPLAEAEHIVEAICVNKKIAQALSITEKDPCLKITRKTASEQGVVSLAFLIHPGSRYRLGGHLDF